MILIWIAVFSSIFAVNSAGQSGIYPTIGIIALMFLGMSVLVGPQMLRNDFRQDLPAAEILKMYPMRGWQLALGEILAPALILTAIQWFLLIVGLGFFAKFPHEETLSLWPRLVLGFSAAIIFPMLNFLTLLIPNAAVLMFPSWVQAGKHAPAGIEATGQRLIFAIGQFLVLSIALIPAAAGFAGAYFVGNFFLKPFVLIPLSAIFAAIILAVEGSIGLILLGRFFERLDLSEETTN
jgi:hypothetical protein